MLLNFGEFVMLDLGAIGLRIKSCRNAQGLTREEFSEKINVSPRFIYDIELGNKGMSIDTLSSIGKTLNVPVDYILFGEVTNEMEITPETLALVERCPKNKIDYLNEIIKNYVQALKEDE